MNEKVRLLLNKCNIPFSNEEQLQGMKIPRDIFLSMATYNSISGDIQEIKTIYSSSAMTGLQQTASKKERWPLLNLVRQLLKASSYNMRPIRECDGYTKEGKKKYKRYFQIERYKNVKEAVTT